MNSISKGASICAHSVKTCPAVRYIFFAFAILVSNKTPSRQKRMPLPSRAKVLEVYISLEFEFLNSTASGLPTEYILLSLWQKKSSYK